MKMNEIEIDMQTSPAFVNVAVVQGERGLQGPQGEKGEPGTAGYTPRKGVDYFTTNEINEVISEVRSSFPTKISDLQNDAGFITSETDPIFTASAASGITAANITTWNNKSDFSGDYTDLTNKPNIPTKVSDLQNDSGFITSETDPIFTASAASGITAANITTWNNKSDFSGDYTDLTNKPTIPTALSDLSGTLAISQGGTGASTAAEALSSLGAQASTDNSLSTTAKTIVGAINEIYSTVGTANDNLEEALNGGN